MGQTVWVLGLKDILKTLDSDGKLDGLPLMPEMLPYCGRSFRISCLPNRTCVEGAGICEFSDIVFLDDLRCDGGAHDGCQRRCRLFWKEAWLSDRPSTRTAQDATDAAAATEAGLKTTQGDRYFCQSTELAGAATAYPQGKPGFGRRLGRDLCDLQLGNTAPLEFLRHALKAVSNALRDLAGTNTAHAVHGRLLKTQTASLDLQQGDLVEIKSREEIEATLDASGRNRGLLFTPPMLKYCGGRFQVANRLQKMILEESGRMIQLKDTVVLDGVTCETWGCRRSNLQFWREIWLKRVEPGS
ncbi:MAG TPA: hypothetical protein VHP13_02465 [Gammaproteobacteria bacterium]|jgi:hypothetical protein|nr:hypothetical protein [Gammaproteobacteria bacterium]